MKILVLSHLSVVGSGYNNLILPILEELHKYNHEIKVIGLDNRGEEHNFPFPIFPVHNADIKVAMAIAQNILNLWHFDVFICALDIPMQEIVLKMMGTTRPFKYIGILPIEAPPLCMSWAMVLMQMDQCFIISKFGTEEAKSKGLSNVEYLELGIDKNIWHSVSADEKLKLRTAFGIEEDEFVILSIGDNQERKNLDALFLAFKIFTEKHPKVKAKLVLITRINLPVGWKLDELAQEYGILDKLILLERGLPFKELFGIYAMSNVFILTSKAEGLGLPLLEALAMGLPCIATACTGMQELLDDGRGVLVPEIMTYRDPFGDGMRWMIDPQKAAEALHQIYNNECDLDFEDIQNFISDRTWEKAGRTVQDYLEQINE